MKVCLITIDSWRHDYVPAWFLEKHKLKRYTNARVYFAGTAPSVTSFYTGVSPIFHGIKDHILFYKYPLLVSTIFDSLKAVDVEVAYATNERLCWEFQCVQNVPKIEFSGVVNFLTQDKDLFLAIHMYWPLHAPYGSEEVEEYIKKYNIHSRNPKSWSEDWFKVARENYAVAVQKALKSNSELLVKFPDANYILSADHGEALGEEGIWGHERFNLECVLRVPLLVSNNGKEEVDNKLVYAPKFAFNQIKEWFGCQD